MEEIQFSYLETLPLYIFMQVIYLVEIPTIFAVMRTSKTLRKRIEKEVIPNMKFLDVVRFSVVPDWVKNVFFNGYFRDIKIFTSL
jgi:hypothetical protein